MLGAQLAAKGARTALRLARRRTCTSTRSPPKSTGRRGAKLAIAQLLGTPSVPAATNAKSFADLHQRLDATIAYLREIAPATSKPA